MHVCSVLGVAKVAVDEPREKYFLHCRWDERGYDEESFTRISRMSTAWILYVTDQAEWDGSRLGHRRPLGPGNVHPGRSH